MTEVVVQLQLPLDIPSLTHDFVYAVDWDVNNTKLVEWAKQYIDVDNFIWYNRNTFN